MATNSNNEKGLGRILCFPGVNPPDETETGNSDNSDVGAKGRRDLIESQRECVKLYLRLPGANPSDVVEDIENYEIRIRTIKGEVPILRFLSKILKKKSDLKSVG